MIEDLIIKFYKGKINSKPLLQNFNDIKNSSELNLTTLNIGLGDAVILTAITNDQSKNLNIFSPNKHWQTICKFNNYLNKNQTSDDYIRTELLEFFNIGNGHLSQRLQRSFGINIERKPKPYIQSSSIRNKKKIGLHFSTGISAFDLLAKGFDNPRQLTEESKKVISDFILNSDYEFSEFGGERIFDFEKVENCTHLNIEESINKLNECEYFIGLNSGFMNLAAGLDIKSIVIVNVPQISNLYLPVLVDCGIEDTNWLYPQNVHLFQNAENKLVPKLSVDYLNRALNGEVYPFWSEKYLDLIYDYDFS